MTIFDHKLRNFNVFFLQPDAVNEDEHDKFNEILAEETNDVEIKPSVKNNNYLHDANMLRIKHQDIKDNFDRLERVSAKGPNSQEFIEPKVQGLWRMASNSNFTADELASLKVKFTFRWLSHRLY